jgi:hypothetical protein
MKLWRLHLRPTDIDAHDAVQHCLDNGFLGLGWGGLKEIEGEATADYLKRHREELMDGKRERSVHGILERVRESDLIWARDAAGGFLLGRATDQAYPRFGKHADLRDMYHVVPANIIGGRVGTHAILDTEVPGAIKATFTRPRSATFHRIHEQHLLDYSAWLFAIKTGIPEPKLDPSPFLDMLDPYELEDLVALYLQEHGWRVVLSSHAPNTPRYEATFVHPEHGTAGVQVKHRGADLDAGRYADDPQVGRVFLFTASGKYGETRPANVTIISERELIAFARERRAMLPQAISYWFNRSVER